MGQQKRTKFPRCHAEKQFRGRQFTDGWRVLLQEVVGSCSTLINSAEWPSGCSGELEDGRWQTAEGRGRRRAQRSEIRGQWAVGSGQWPRSGRGMRGRSSVVSKTVSIERSEPTSGGASVTSSSLMTPPVVELRRGALRKLCQKCGPFTFRFWSDSWGPFGAGSARSGVRSERLLLLVLTYASR